MLRFCPALPSAALLETLPLLLQFLLPLSLLSVHHPSAACSVDSTMTSTLVQLSLPLAALWLCCLSIHQSVGHSLSPLFILEYQLNPIPLMT